MEFILEPLNLVTFFPLVGVLSLLFVNNEKKNLARWVALVASTITFGISLVVSQESHARFKQLRRHGLKGAFAEPDA